MEQPIDEQLSKGLAHHQNGSFDEAEEHYKNAVAIQPLNAETNHRLGKLRTAQDRPEEALTFFEIAVTHQPNDEQYWGSYIGTLKHLGNDKLAKKQLKRLKKLNLQYGQIKKLVKEQTATFPSTIPKTRELEALVKSFQSGLYEDAIKKAAPIIKQHSSHVLSQKIMSAALWEVQKFDEAIDLASKLTQIAPADSEIHNNLSVMLLSIGRSEEAVLAARRAIELKTDYPEAFSNLGLALREMGELSEAANAVRKCIDLNSAFPDAHVNLGLILKDAGQFQGAKHSFKEALSLNPDFPVAHFNLGLLLLELGLYEEAFRHFDLSRVAVGKDHMLTCLYKLNNRERFLEQLEDCLASNRVSAVIGSMIDQAWFRYGVKYPNVFVEDAFKYVSKVDLKKDHDFEKVFIAPVLRVIEEESGFFRYQERLLNGVQTAGNIFSRRETGLQDIYAVICREIENYREKFTGCEEGFLRSWPENYKVNGWLIKMVEGGELKPHYHESGWLSGAVYVDVPQKIKSHEGDFVVCKADEKEVNDERNPPLEIVGVETGDMVLFPSSLMHYTIPFTGRSRIVLAFDVVASD